MSKKEINKVTVFQKKKEEKSINNMVPHKSKTGKLIKGQRKRDNYDDRLYIERRVVSEYFLSLPMILSLSI